jgi:hypothetical protein
MLDGTKAGFFRDEAVLTLESLASNLTQFSFFPAMVAIWHLRPFLQRRFPLHRRRAHDWIGFFAWCCSDGRKDYAVLRESRDLRNLLCSRIELPRLKGDEWEGQISMAILCCGMARYRWSLAPMVGAAIARKRAARAFWRGERHERFLPTARWQMEKLAADHDEPSELLKKIFLPEHDRGKEKEALVEKFGLQDVFGFAKGKAAHLPDGRGAIWIGKEQGRALIPLPPKIWRLACDLQASLCPIPTEKQRASVTGQVSLEYRGPNLQAGLPFGVNLFGYARGELGIGEDIRQVAVALAKQGIPVCLVNFEPGKNISQADRSADHLVVEAPRYAFNIFCMTGIETVRYACERGLEPFAGRYNIGLWPWELPDWPESCRHAYSFVDEVWGISEYTAHAHRFAAPRPVVPMTLPVSLGEVGSQGRKDFGLPADAYLYCFAFDINSSAARKNPEGLIAAFQKAFPRKRGEDVGLVLKISHPETGCALWDRIRKAAARDRRVHLVEKTMRRPELLALFNVCDCFVSLHRAEGFGRCLAEALLLGKQVVATGFSGNRDFCQEPRVALVRHRMVPLKPGDYMWGGGQEWADPDLDHAAELLRSVRKNPRPKDEQGFPFLHDNAGHRFAVRLKELWGSFEAR